MPRNFYIGSDAQIVTGSANFASLIATGFASYGLTSAQSTAFGLLNTALQTAYPLAVEPPTRTSVTIEQKNLAIKNMRFSAITLSKIIYATATVNDSQLLALGLLPRSSRTPVPPPATRPVIDIIAVTGNVVRVRLHPEGESTRRGKPAGVDGAAIYSFVGAVPPDVESEWDFQGLASKVDKIDVPFPGAAPGSQVWFTAFWFNSRKQNGPAAAKVTTNIAGGSAMAA